jgi:hypothetical protein
MEDSFLRSTVLLTLCLLAFLPAPAQQPATEIPPVAMHAFEVISIRPSGKDSNYSFFFTQDGFRASGQTLWSLISLAYLPAIVVPRPHPERAGLGRKA